MKPDPLAGVAELAVDDGMGKPEKVDSGTGVVADIQKCRVTTQTSAAGMEGLPAALGELRMVGWEGFSGYHIHFAPISDALCAVQQVDGVDEGIRLDGFETACWISAWGVAYMSATSSVHLIWL